MSNSSSTTPLLGGPSAKPGSRYTTQQQQQAAMRKKHSSRNECMSVRQVGATLGIVILLLSATTLWFSTLSNNSPNNGGGHRRTTLKEPSTPPDSLPSDPYAQYIYQEELQLKYDDAITTKPVSDNNNDGQRRKHNGRRTIVVGDVHGSFDGFERFLRKIEHNPQKDTLVLAGDIVAKGPQSLKVIDRLIDLQAKCVRGNHDDTVIRWRGFLDSLEAAILEAFDASFITLSEDSKDEAAGHEHNDDDDVVNAAEEAQAVNVESFFFQRGIAIPSDLDRRSEHYQIARAMTKDQYDYLRQCPLILTIPRDISVNRIPVHVVHAGIDPTRDILKQRPWVLVNIRNLLKDGTPSRKKSKGRGWAREFNELHNRRSPSKRDFLVVYGHDAGRSLNVMSWSIGLDTGCVYGRELTGYVVETGLIVSSPCPHV
ncbi:hypothetical protein BGX33_001773 [Mortierella sp. NVP41]|nr:hypothetical protein BGX33_001773 [Mortierella sp. NVP41]